MGSKFHLLVDSDGFVGRFYTKDAHHERAVSLFAKHEGRNSVLTTTSMVVAETATVLSHRSGQIMARKFLDIIMRSSLALIHIDEKLHQEALRIFCSQNKRGTSVVDCANVAVMRRFNISQILSFDQGYAKEFGLKVAD